MKHLLYIAVSIVSYNVSAQTSAYSQQRQYNDYISPVNTQLVNQVLAKKEASYQKNYQKVSEKIEFIDKLIGKLIKTKYDKLTKNQVDYIDSLIKYVPTITTQKLSNDFETEQILKTLKIAEDTLIDWL